MNNVKIIIGANYGDEGKGLITDFFSQKENTIVVLTNGGAQRGHTVELKNGTRHVFHHFGSGTLRNAATYCAKTFILNPMTYIKEKKELEKEIGKELPCFYAHPSCRWSSPFDMLLNQITEQSRGNNKHGSCGMGIWETVSRYNNCVGISFKDFCDKTTEEKIDFVRNTLKKNFEIQLQNRMFTNLAGTHRNIIDNDSLILHFVQDCEEMAKDIVFAEENILQNYSNVVFENGQGLMLDDHFMKYATPSNTGIKDAQNIIQTYLPNSQVETCFVTRTYLTRHGARDFEENFKGFVDYTNINNEFQGGLRFKTFDNQELHNLTVRIVKEISDTPSNWKASLAITHANEMSAQPLLKTMGFLDNFYYSSTKFAADII